MNRAILDANKAVYKRVDGLLHLYVVRNIGAVSYKLLMGTMIDDVGCEIMSQAYPTRLKMLRNQLKVD